MSGRGRGGGRGPPRRDHPPPPSHGRRGGGGGRGPPARPVSVTVPPVIQPTVSVTSSLAPVASSSSSTTSTSLTRDIETKLTLQSPPEALPVLPPASSKAYVIPARPGYGKEGRKCVVRANHFLVKVADKDLHHYDVSQSIIVLVIFYLLKKKLQLHLYIFCVIY